MWHVTVLAFPICWLYGVLAILHRFLARVHPACQNLVNGMRNGLFLSVQLVAVLVIRLLVVVDEEKDTGREKVGG